MTDHEHTYAGVAYHASHEDQEASCALERCEDPSCDLFRPRMDVVDGTVVLEVPA